MELEKIDGVFTVCKVRSASQINFQDEFCFVGKTDSELSLVCPSQSVPPDAIERDDGWKCFRIRGVLDFSLIGILSALTDVLARNRIGVFAVSTFNTDYILVKSADFDRALSALSAEGYKIV